MSEALAIIMLHWYFDVINRCTECTVAEYATQTDRAIKMSES